MRKILKFTGYTAVVLALVIGAAVFYVSKFLPNVGKAPDLKVFLTTDKVERGRYLANSVALCMDCHSTRDWTLYAGPPKPGTLGVGGEYFSPEMGIPGHVYSRNITPFRLKDWTDGEIYRAITTGVSKDGSALFPLMPYKYYGQMDPEDINCIIAYLRTLEPIASENKETKLDFPVSLLVNMEPQKANPTKLPKQSDTLAYGRYMVNAAGCVECHSPVDKQAKIIAGKEFSGGRAFPMLGGLLTTPNITQDKETGIGGWDANMFVQRFKMYADTGYRAPAVKPTDFNTIMPWMMYAQMTETDLRAMYAYLKTVKPIQNKIEKFKPKNEVTMR
ncbi:MAG: c-type cytochrome [Bacteroidota bacterium]